MTSARMEPSRSSHGIAFSFTTGPLPGDLTSLVLLARRLLELLDLRRHLAQLVGDLVQVRQPDLPLTRNTSEK
jgi:hypothetical protein